ncbi:hypothetical protein BDV06DRAFT_191553 [Aspergillus oleicola]
MGCDANIYLLCFCIVLVSCFIETKCGVSWISLTADFLGSIKQRGIAVCDKLQSSLCANEFIPSLLITCSTTLAGTVCIMQKQSTLYSVQQGRVEARQVITLWYVRDKKQAAVLLMLAARDFNGLWSRGCRICAPGIYHGELLHRDSKTHTIASAQELCDSIAQ